MIDELLVFDDVEPRSAAMNMAVDEALLLSAVKPSLRFYRWRSLALSFGYFGSFSEVADEESDRELVRRWTGGGIVLHGTDLTYSVILPGSSLAVPREIYSFVHKGILGALANHTQATLATASASKVSAACFANPVEADVMALDGRKIAGAAQRRTRAGLLHQGSIQCDLPPDFKGRLARALCARSQPSSLTETVLDRASQIAHERYATAAWLRRR